MRDQASVRHSVTEGILALLGVAWIHTRRCDPNPHFSRSLDLVTPKDVQGYAAFSNKEGATAAATSFLLQWTLQKAIQKYRETKDERARAAAREEVIEALNALEQARAKAGLPRK